MLTTDRVSGMALFFLALVTAWETRRLPLGSFHNPGPGYMPMLLAAILGALGVLVAIRGAGSPLLRTLSWSESRHAAAIVAGCAFSAIAVERLGYRLTVIVVVAFLLGALERKRPVITLALALALSFGSFYLFSTVLKVPLPRGPFGF